MKNKQNFWNKLKSWQKGLVVGLTIWFSITLLLGIFAVVIAGDSFGGLVFTSIFLFLFIVPISFFIGVILRDKRILISSVVGFLVSIVAIIFSFVFRDSIGGLFLLPVYPVSLLLQKITRCGISNSSELCLFLIPITLIITLVLYPIIAILIDLIYRKVKYNTFK